MSEFGPEPFNYEEEPEEEYLPSPEETEELRRAAAKAVQRAVEEFSQGDINKRIKAEDALETLKRRAEDESDPGPRNKRN